MHVEISRRNRLSQPIGSAACVRAGIFGQTLKNVQRDESKVVRFGESRSEFDRYIVVEPLDLHGVIRHWDQSTFEMSSLAFFDIAVFQRSSENRGLRCGLFHVFSSVISSFFFEILDLFQAHFVLSICYNTRRAC